MKRRANPIVSAPGSRSVPAATTRAAVTCSSFQRLRARSRRNVNRYVPEGRPRLPQRFVGNAGHGVPDRLIVLALAPAARQVLVEERRHLHRQPRRHVRAVRDGPDRPAIVLDAGPDRPPHVARDLAVQLAHAVDVVRRAERERRHVEERAAAVVVVSERQERITVRAERAPRAGKMRLHEGERKRVVAGGHRRVRREDGRPPNALERRFERRAFFDPIADALQDHEGRVPLVQMPGGRLDAQRLERAHAADAEDDLLLDPRLAIAAVEPRRELAVPWRVLFEIGVEEKELHASEPHEPHRHEHRAVAERYGDHAGTAVGGDRLLDRRVLPVQSLVHFLLPPFRRHHLVEVALRVHEADADERNAEVARFLAVIAREHAEAACVDRERLMERELRREVRDRSMALGMAVLPPRVARAARGVERRERLVVQREERRIGRCAGEKIRGDRPQHQHGVVGGLPPQRIVELAEYVPRVRVPRPPEIGGELGQAVEPGGNGRRRRIADVNVHEWSSSRKRDRILLQQGRIANGTRRRAARTWRDRCCRPTRRQRRSGARDWRS